MRNAWQWHITTSPLTDQDMVRKMKPAGVKNMRNTGMQSAGLSNTSLGKGNPSEEDVEEACQTIDWASSLMNESRNSVALSNLETAILLYRQLRAVTPATHPLWRDIIYDLASALGAKFLHSDEQADFSELEEVANEILRIEELVEPQGSEELNGRKTEGIEKAAHEEMENYHKAFSLSMANNVIYLLRQCLHRLPVSHTKRHTGLNILAYTLYIRYHHTADVTNLVDASSALWNNSRTEASLPNSQVAHQHLLAVCAAGLHDTEIFFNFNNAYSELPRRMTTTTLPLGNEEDPDYGAGLCQAFRSSGDLAQLEEGINRLRNAVTNAPRIDSLNPFLLNNLATALAEHFSVCHDDADLEQAIYAAHNAMCLTGSQHPQILENLSTLLLTRFAEGISEADDFDAAIALRFRALKLIDPVDSLRAGLLLKASMAAELRKRYELGHDIHDLDMSILLYGQVFDTCSRRTRLPYVTSNFLDALALRFENTRDTSDLDEAIRLQSEVMDSLLPCDPGRWQALALLGGLLQDRFEKSNPSNPQDLDHAISFCKQAVAVGPPICSDYHALLRKLVSLLVRRFKLRRMSRDMEDSFLTQNRLVNSFPPNHPGRPDAAHALAELHLLAYDMTSESEFVSKQKHLEEAMSGFSKSASASPQTPSDRFHKAATWAIYADNFGYHTAGKAYDMALEALPHIASFTDDPQIRQLVLNSEAIDGIPRKAARYAIKTGQLDKAIEYLEIGRGIFWSQALRLRSPPDQLHGVTPDLEQNLQPVTKPLEDSGSYTQVAPDVGYKDEVPIEEANQLEKDVEQWTKMIHAPRDLLRPKKLSALQTAAEDGTIIYLIANHDSSDCLVMTTDTVQHIPLPFLTSAKLFSFLKRLEAVHSDSQNSSAPGHFGMVENEYVGVGAFQGRDHGGVDDILRVMPRSFHVSFDRKEDQDFAPSFMRAAVEAVISGPNQRWQAKPEKRTYDRDRKYLDLEDEEGTRAAKKAMPKVKSSDDEFKEVLSSLWDSGIKSIIDRLGLEIIKHLWIAQKTKGRTTVKWCPTGLFASLPIHAAGRYDTGKVDCVSDYIISSYIPNAGSLLTEGAEPPSAPLKMMTVIQSESLPSTKKELEKVERHVGATSTSIIKFGVPDAPASVEKVASKKSQASIVHFACHGKQNKRNPLKSGLEIEGERLTISRIMEEKVPSGALAFLSACETAARDERMPDEDLSIGASLLFAGYRSVVATMWRMEDSDGPVIADAFYEELCRGPDGTSLSRPDTRRSAKALAIAVEKLRSKGVPFKRWVPFIHMGK
ncbi:hypothetical protein CVT26_015522 [Gymnopilus dilepis]|uniref:CHAT domain-containing protein n=1 Tax=Gymnopilus dilepis TaxID=231916 RepID=A0A409YD12_9AGAR|nr:hypothetical protein CVT26_015522 [Gymnopilus dilepis]